MNFCVIVTVFCFSSLVSALPVGQNGKLNLKQINKNNCAGDFLNFNYFRVLFFVIKEWYFTTCRTIIHTKQC